MNIKSILNYVGLIALLSIPNYQLFAQKSRPVANPATIFELLSQSEKLIIETDLDHLINVRRSEEYIPAQVVLEDGQIYDLKINSRGKFRRRMCEFPPLSLKFSKSGLKELGFAKHKHNKLKLVTHCLENEKTVGNDNVLKEYLAYKIFNEISPNSFVTKVFKITYRDTSGKLKDIKRYGFLIEDTDEMAERLGGKECDECFNSAMEVISKVDEANVSLFQYMIGNEDWGTENMKNVKIVNRPDGIRIPGPLRFRFLWLCQYQLCHPKFRL